MNTDHSLIQSLNFIYEKNQGDLDNKKLLALYSVKNGVLYKRNPISSLIDRISCWWQCLTQEGERKYTNNRTFNLVNDLLSQNSTATLSENEKKAVKKCINLVSQEYLSQKNLPHFHACINRITSLGINLFDSMRELPTGRPIKNKKE